MLLVTPKCAIQIKEVFDEHMLKPEFHGLISANHPTYIIIGSGLMKHFIHGEIKFLASCSSYRFHVHSINYFIKA